MNKSHHSEPSKGVLRGAALSGLLLLSAGGFSAASTTAGAKPRIISWLVAHDRHDKDFNGINQKFADELYRRSDGRLKIKFVVPNVPESLLDSYAYRHILKGDVDMSQFGATAAHVSIFDMPFVFRSYPQAEMVFRGPIGARLLSSIAESSGGKLRGMGFTYSGGFRILVGAVPLRRLSDFKGVRMRRGGGGTYLDDLLTPLGVKLVPPGPSALNDPIAGIVRGKLDLEETEVNRLAFILRVHPELRKRVKYINLTDHRMLVTALVANEKFFDSLSPRDQRVLTQVMQELSVAERKLSVRLVNRNLAQMTRYGSTVVTMSPSEKEKFVAAGNVVLNRFTALHSLVEEIRALPTDGRLARR
ncbi:MAG: TRAP transporter substrate-binding protein DctP [Elusimicrobia bacterium]|nr:TRAP transporter substrate-binding protein DctP [Elusimicrobiota bacterium]